MNCVNCLVHILQYKYCNFYNLQKFVRTIDSTDECPCLCPNRADFEAGRHLRSASSLSLAARRTRLFAVGDRAFPIDAARNWNSLPQHLMSAPFMSVFRGRLKAYIFKRSFTRLLPEHFCSVCAVTVVISDT